MQSRFDNNRENDHDHVNARAELIEYDPALAALCEEVFGTTKAVDTKPQTRLQDQPAGYDPATAPRFRWPEHLDAVKVKIRRKAQERSQQP